MAKGYVGRHLRVDLTDGRCSDFTIEAELLRKFIGGSALGANLFLDGFPLEADPLSPETPLMVMTGPMVGSGFPGISRFAVCAKSPLTGIWGKSACGGTFGPELKKAGYDGIVITGRAAVPVVLAIVDGEARLSDASDLWGRDVYETTDLLKAGEPGVKVLAIGQAGENLVRFAAIGNDKGHFVGRTGLGAVMGAKRLKAICVRGSGKLEKADEARFREIHKAAVLEIKESALAGSLHAMGSDANMDIGMINGDVPVKNWSVGEDFELSGALSGPTLSETYLTRSHACSHCPVACKRVVKVADGPFQTEEGPGPEYETCATFGTMIMNGDLAGVIKANEMCNRYGMDTISCGSAIACSRHAFGAPRTGRAELRSGACSSGRRKRPFEQSLERLAA